MPRRARPRSRRAWEGSGRASLGEHPRAGSPAFNFLTGSGGFSQVFTYGLTGLRWRENAVHLDPMLPPQLSAGVTLRGLRWQGRTFDVAIGASTDEGDAAQRQRLHD